LEAQYTMLEKLFGSKARVKILKLFLGKPEEKFYIRQISRDLKLQLNSVRRELDNLEKFGLLTSAPEEKNLLENEDIFIQTKDDIKASKTKKTKKMIKEKTDKKYFRVNSNFVLYEEVKALILKAQILYERDFIEKLNKAGKAKLLILAGDFVNDPSSPVDMFLVGRLNKTKLLKLIKELENELNRELNYSVMGTGEFKYRRDITDIFLYGILEGKKLIVIDEIGIS